MRQAIEVGERTFILCYMKHHYKRYFIPGNRVIDIWDMWKRNKGKRGFNTIEVKDMEEIKSGNGIALDYLEHAEGWSNEGKQKNKNRITSR